MARDVAILAGEARRADSLLRLARRRQRAVARLSTRLDARLGRIARLDVGIDRRRHQ